MLWAAIALTAGARIAPGAATASCAGKFLAGRPPALLSEVMRKRTTALCDEGYAALASGVTKGALWSAEHLTADTITAARSIPREGRFHADGRVPWDDSAQLSDYRDSGYDRGHMSPSGDMPTASAQEGSFSLANMVPQSAKLNRGRWEAIEESVRAMTLRDGEVYVVTGPAFEGTEVGYVGARHVLVPSSTWKAVADVARRATGAWICTNDDAAACQVVPVSEIARRARIDPFPALPEADKTTPMTLPPPGRGRYRGN